MIRGTRLARVCVCVFKCACVFFLLKLGLKNAYLIPLLFLWDCLIGEEEDPYNML